MKKPTILSMIVYLLLFTCATQHRVNNLNCDWSSLTANESARMIPATFYNHFKTRVRFKKIKVPYFPY